MDNIQRYNDEIKKCRDYLSAIVVAMNELFKKTSTKKNAGMLKKQKNLFQNLNNKSREKNFYKFYNSYSKKTTTNLKKMSYVHVSSSKIEEILRNDTRRFDSSIISKIGSIISRNDELKGAIVALSGEFNETISKIKMYKNLIESEKQSEIERKQERENKIREYNKPKLTEEQIAEQRKKQELEMTQQRIDKNANILLKGPKSGGLGALLQGKDAMLKDMEYLYGLAMDIFVIMDMDQKVNIKNASVNSDARLYNANVSTFIDYKKSKTDMILNTYGVKNIEQLLNKYDKIQKQYYKKFSKLSKEKKEKYDISNFEFYDIEGNFENNADSHLLDAFKNEKFNFPPSKDALIYAMNRRIMNGKNYKLVQPKQQEVITGEPNRLEDFFETKKYYENLTKNMSIEEISELYKHVVMDMREGFRYSGLDSKDIKSYSAVMQKLFCEVIFDKKGMEVLDYKQKDQAIKEIAETILEEQLDFSIYGSDKVTEEEQEKRLHTLRQNYCKYLVKMDNQGKRKECLSYSEFCNKKYGITNVVEPKNLEEMLKEEIKGMKK